MVPQGGPCHARASVGGVWDERGCPGSGVPGSVFYRGLAIGAAPPLGGEWRLAVMTGRDVGIALDVLDRVTKCVEPQHDPVR